MFTRKHILVRVVAYIVVFVLAYVLIGAIVLAILGEGVLPRVATACLALACMAAGRYISTRVWGRATAAK
jgi:hypothetical protein